ncbi:MAG: helix-turn-helix transcriptional regulator [Dermatophilaceae bacterium]
MPPDRPTTWSTLRSAGDLGRRVADARREQSLTQGDLAAWLGVDRTTVIRLEAGKVSQLDRLFDVLGVLGLDLIAVPRTARVVVETADDQSPT